MNKKIKIIFYKTDQSYIDFILNQLSCLDSANSDSNISNNQLSSQDIITIKTSNRDEFNRSLGIKVECTPKYYYNFKHILLFYFEQRSLNKSINLKIKDFDNTPGDGYIDSLFEVGIHFVYNSDDIFETIYMGGKLSASTGIIKQEEKYLFLDRDGVINHDYHYPASINDISFYHEIISIIKLFKQADYKIVVVSNQSGIARGKLDYSKLSEIEIFLNQKFDQYNISIFKWIYCPYHEEGSVLKFKQKSFLRKPYPGMILNFMHQYPVDIINSFMIGDKASDDLNIKGLQTYFIKGRYPIDKKEKLVFNNHNDLLKYFKHLL